MRKITVGLIESVKIKGQKGTTETLGKFDTGAQRTSIDKTLFTRIGANPVGEIMTHSVHGKSIRSLVDLRLEIKGKRVNVRANVSDRSSRKYKILIGRDVIFSNFIVDVSKSHKSHKLRDIK